MFIHRNIYDNLLTGGNLSGIKMANDHRVMADVERRRNRRRDSERKRRRVHRVLEYFESTRCIVTRAYPWSTLSTIRNQPRYTGGGSCTCRANGSLAELRAYTRCRIQIEHIDTTHLPPKKLLILPICLRVDSKIPLE